MENVIDCESIVLRASFTIPGIAFLSFQLALGQSTQWVLLLMEVMELFNATSLHSIFLYSNNLSGPLSPSICHLLCLQNLDLSQNSLSGSLLSDLANCCQLQRFVLSCYKFFGEIFDGIWPNLDNLLKLDLSSNEFNGSIPADLGDLKSLSETLNLSNHFSDEFPRSLDRLLMMVSFGLRHNNLNEQIPQIGTFENQGPTAFLNNPSLCGFPLQTPCIGNPPKSSPLDQQNQGTIFDTNSKKGLKPGFAIER
ncbi:PREDICTED: receptor protein kinase-like protein ZAR1 [Nelumbo nucifera]|uniref:Receptor protein kinase-like protein ZAR1 n=1 Tax=Nelumbo nucifera TaxID=4432 RepID=A0A1U8ADA4_NELNU|nr:PREDICTED: receptor protein kinase-like protein ZAR1 [Nelumbo nucifera]